jgi:hypothetical protein
VIFDQIRLGLKMGIPQNDHLRNSNGCKPMDFGGYFMIFFRQSHIDIRPDDWWVEPFGTAMTGG